MNAVELLRHYERLVDAPGAVERLRRFILALLNFVWVTGHEG